MLGYLRVSGPETRFNVLLFSDDTVRWKSRLQVANERNLGSVESWLLYNGPQGGTALRDAYVNIDWDAVHFAFVTEDGSGQYYTAGELLPDGTLRGTTLSTGRRFLGVWTGARAD